MNAEIYIAGPLFSEAERSQLERLAAFLEVRGFSTYLPHRDGGLAGATERETRVFFEADIKALDEARAVVAVLNGADVDSGTAFEMGYAFAKAKALVGIYDDTRIGDPSVDINLMIVNATTIVRTPEEIVEVIMRASRGR